MPLNIDSPLARRVAAFAFLIFIFGLTLWVLSPFFASLAWAGILAYVGFKIITLEVSGAVATRRTD